jgi:hypothetical protein
MPFYKVVVKFGIFDLIPHAFLEYFVWKESKYKVCNHFQNIGNNTYPPIQA